jgi:hypothetical protein
MDYQTLPQKSNISGHKHIYEHVDLIIAYSLRQFIKSLAANITNTLIYNDAVLIITVL